MMKPARRSFLGLLPTTPLAAREAFRRRRYVWTPVLDARLPAHASPVTVGGITSVNQNGFTLTFTAGTPIRITAKGRIG